MMRRETTAVDESDEMGKVRRQMQKIKVER